MKKKITMYWSTDYGSTTTPVTSDPGTVSQECFPFHLSMWPEETEGPLKSPEIVTVPKSQQNQDIPSGDEAEPMWVLQWRYLCKLFQKQRVILQRKKLCLDFLPLMFDIFILMFLADLDGHCSLYFQDKDRRREYTLGARFKLSGSILESDLREQFQRYHKMFDWFPRAFLPISWTLTHSFILDLLSFGNSRRGHVLLPPWVKQCVLVSYMDTT